MRIAIDNCVLLNRANEVGQVIEAFLAIDQKFRPVELLITPTVLQELSAKYEMTEERRRLSLIALQSLLSWGIKPVNLVPVGHGIIERIAQTIRDRGIVPQEEVHDSCIIAEAAFCGCDMLLSSDKHCWQDAGKDNLAALWEILADAHAAQPQLAIFSPQHISRFYTP